MQCSYRFASGQSISDNVANLSDRVDQRSVNRAQKCLLFSSRTVTESTLEVSASGERELARPFAIIPFSRSQPPRAKMRWPVNSPIMQNYSPLLEPPFSSQPCDYETVPITSRE